ncbi:hypothetical protein LCGC14_0955450, partial [marine sediment metagenome]|nr:M15 family peptidase [Methylophaga sp.]
MSLRERQSLFASLFAKLILYAYEHGYEISIGDVYATDGHIEGSFHYEKLAGDLNLFLNGRYLMRTEDH